MINGAYSSSTAQAFLVLLLVAIISLYHVYYQLYDFENLKDIWYDDFNKNKNI